MSVSSIPITIDKSHLTTIGTRLYAESLDLVRELAANAYDADATRVNINLTETELTVEDNGSGMDREGLKQYFTIGSDFKKLNPFSPVLKRQRIGEFGIGKFAVLSLCDHFSIFTKKESYTATVIFDKEQFEKGELWEVPIVENEGNTGQNGTKVTLSNLKYFISTEQLEKRLRQQLPLGQKDFAVFINGVKLSAHTVPGRKYRVREQTEFGQIAGEIILSSLLLQKELEGIAIKVKGMLIKRDYFGLESKKDSNLRRLTGEINADFLPLTSARDNFLKDTPEYKVFSRVIAKKIKQLEKDLRKFSLTRQDIKTDQALSNALDLVKKALKKNPDIFLTHDLPLFAGAGSFNNNLNSALGSTTVSKSLGKAKKIKKSFPDKLKEIVSGIKGRKRRQMVKTVLKDKDRLIKRIKIGGMNLTCSLSHMGEEEPESFVEGGIIFINRDHHLFCETAKSEELASYHLARLITQEVTKLANPLNISQAYDWQSRLLTDAFVDKKKGKE